MWWKPRLFSYILGAIIANDRFPLSVNLLIVAYSLGTLHVLIGSFLWFKLHIPSQTVSMKRFVALCAFALALASTPSIASAQFLVGPQLGVNLDGSDFFFGANVRFPITIGEYALTANPNLDLYLFEDDVTAARFNIDALYTLAQLSDLDTYIGAGLLIEYTSVDLPPGTPDNIESSDTDLGINLKLGATFAPVDAGFQPFVEGHFTLKDNSDLAFRAGVLFPLN